MKVRESPAECGRLNMYGYKVIKYLGMNLLLVEICFDLCLTIQI